MNSLSAFIVMLGNKEHSKKVDIRMIHVSLYRNICIDPCGQEAYNLAIRLGSEKAGGQRRSAQNGRLKNILYH